MIYRTVGPSRSGWRPNNMYFSICVSTGDLFYPWSTKLRKAFHFGGHSDLQSTRLQRTWHSASRLQAPDRSASPAIFELRHCYLLPSLPASLMLLADKSFGLMTSLQKTSQYL